MTTIADIEALGIEVPKTKHYYIDTSYLTGGRHKVSADAAIDELLAVIERLVGDVRDLRLDWQKRQDAYERRITHIEASERAYQDAGLETEAKLDTLGHDYEALLRKLEQAEADLHATQRVLEASIKRYQQAEADAKMWRTHHGKAVEVLEQAGDAIERLKQSIDMCSGTCSYPDLRASAKEPDLQGHECPDCGQRLLYGTGHLNCPGRTELTP